MLFEGRIETTHFRSTLYFRFTSYCWSRYGGRTPPTRPTETTCYFDFSEISSLPEAEAFRNYHLSMLPVLLYSNFELAFHDNKHQKLGHTLRHKPVLLEVALMCILNPFPIDVA